MSSFSKLPGLPLDLIFKDVNLIDTISFSLISKSTRSIAKSLRKRVKRLKFRKDLATIEILEYQGTCLCNWWITVGANFENLGNNVAKCAVRPEIYNFFYFNTFGTDNQSRFYHLVVNTILDIFKVDQLVLEADSVENISYINLSVPYHLDEIEILADNDNTLSQQDLEYLLEGRLNTDKLIISRKAADNVRYPRSLQIKELVIRDATWLSIDNILGMSCEVLSIHKATLSVQDLQEFLKNWQSGGLENLKWCSIRLALNHYLINVPSVMEGLLSVDWHPPFKRSIQGPRMRVCDEYRMRRSDGRLAIVIVSWCHVDLRVCCEELIS